MGRAKVATRQEVLATISSVMRGEMEDYIIRKGSGGEEILNVPVKLADRMHAAELLGKQLGLFNAVKTAEPGPAADVQALEELFRAAREGSE